MPEVTTDSHLQPSTLDLPEGADAQKSTVSGCVSVTDTHRHHAGLWVAFLGADGSGKSSVRERYVPKVRGMFSDVRVFHLRPRLLRGSAAGRTTNSDPHGQTRRGAVASVVKLFYLWLDYQIGYLVRVFPALRRGDLVLFDRYYYDIQIDSGRFRYGGPEWIVRLLGRLVPRPDLLFVLDAPSEVLQRRKQEVTPAESERQAIAYRSLVQMPLLQGRARLIDASKTLDLVVGHCVLETLAWERSQH
jgi:thymidylate kinase